LFVLAAFFVLAALFVLGTVCECRLCVFCRSEKTLGCKIKRVLCWACCLLPSLFATAMVGAAIRA
jgi:hypothetical protein